MHCHTPRPARERPGTGRADTESAEGAGHAQDERDLAGHAIRASWFGHFSISIRREGDADVVALRGELDIVGAGTLHDCLARLGAHDVVIDLRRLSFVDAAGMSALAIAHARARREGRTLVVRGACREVARVLDIGGLGHLIADPESTLQGKDRDQVGVQHRLGARGASRGAKGWSDPRS